MSAETPLPPCVEVGPDRADAAVIWMHGLGADGHDFEPIVPGLGLRPDQAVRFVFPHADPRPVTINAGMVMRAWYDIRELGGRDEDEPGILASQDQIHRLIGREQERGVAPERIVLAGFSQGGAMALHAGLRSPQRLAGIVGLSCYLLRADTLEREAQPANRDLPILMAHGSFDPMVPLSAGEASRDALTAAGYRVDFRTYPMEHALHPDEIDAIGEFLRQVLAPRN
jgi:phospholipase/carboxylesterase